MLRIYLDMCCYNRPYDDQAQIKTAMEAQAKLYIQDLSKEKKLELISVYERRFAKWKTLSCKHTEYP